MPLFEYIILGTIFLACIIFLFSPRPKLSSRLQAWKNAGKYMEFNNMKIFYIAIKGDAPAKSLVCLHGFPTCSYDWIRIVPSLTKVFANIVVLDFVGFGFSDKPKTHVYTINEQADIVEELMQSLGLTDAHVLSHDYGDTVALELLARHNSDKSKFSIQSLTMLNGGIFPETHHPRPTQKLLLLPVLGYVASHLFSYAMFRKGFGAVFGPHKPSEDDYKDFWAALRYNDGDRAAVGVINFLRERQAFRDRWVGALQAARTKVMMIYGPADPVNPPKFAEHFKKTVLSAELVVLRTDVGHYPQWEDPDAVLEAFIDFVKRVG